MTSTDRERHAEMVRDVLSASADCLPIERISEALTADEEAHVTHCPRCQAERSLWRLADTDTRPEEREAVRWIAAEVGRRRTESGTPAPSRFAWLWLGSGRLAAAAAAIVLVSGIGYLSWTREPALHAPAAVTAYRSTEIQPVAPVGDVKTAPRELEWQAMAGATAYEVVVEEVDHTALWRGASASTRVSLPTSVVEKLVPGKTVLWRVDAKNSAGAVVGQSAATRFRVAIE